jgi:uroporphyrinogen decarboxylase
MNSKERVLSSINHKEPDRVPYDLGGTTVTTITRQAYEAAMKARNIQPGIKTADVDFIQQVVVPSETNLNYLGVDTRRIGANRIPGKYWDELKNKDVIEITDVYGCRWSFQKGRDLYFNQETFPIEKFDMLSEGIPKMQRIQWDEYKPFLFEALSEQITGTDDFCVVADRNSAGLTENSLRVRGYEKWYMDTVIEPDAVEHLLEIFTEDKIKYWDLVIDWAIENNVAQDIHVISEADDLGSQTATIIDPSQLRTIVIPRWKRIYQHVKKRLPHAKIFMHSCGAIREILPDLIDAGVDILNPVQFTASGMELEGLKKDFGNDITFWGGGVDTQNTLNNGNPQQVKDEVKKILDIMAPGGGFVFATIHNVQNDVHPDNFWALWDTLQKYGKY